ncbi:MAG: hypothetical protein RLZZ416_487 [Candidatus Parcubacteria bacterium]
MDGEIIYRSEEGDSQITWSHLCRELYPNQDHGWRLLKDGSGKRERVFWLGRRWLNRQQRADREKEMAGQQA